MDIPGVEMNPGNLFRPGFAPLDLLPLGKGCHHDSRNSDRARHRVGCTDGLGTG